MFSGYCFVEKNGWHCPPVRLNSAEEVWSYVQLQKRIFSEVRITDADDFIVVQALEGKVVFPPEWAQLETQ
ncbi:hypothetical protein [Aneurinibacillus terranovensis]|uniref:hypothetical protein n=1 Tax=Aneurinibacillus terranovensis TaxID=278991 RepID=UPI000404386A|nr:hypothetical protein [Aneurinibacillus terranovensis]